MSVTLDYRFVAGAADVRPGGALQLQNPLLAMLDAIHAQGSIGKAATQLNLSYRHLWGELKRHEAAFGQALITGGQGRAAQLSAFGERLLWAEKRILARLLPQAESLAGQIDRELLLAVDPGLQLLPTCASHDLLFGALREALLRDARVLLDVEYVGSTQALERLNAGACALAGIHLPLDDEHLCRRGSRIHAALGRELRLGTHKLIRVARREQGLMVAAGNPLGLSTLNDLARPGVVFVNRLQGSGTRLIFDELLVRAGVWSADIAGYASGEHTHLSVAANVAAGAANCGFGLRAAADRFGLGFVPLAHEQYFLVCIKDVLETPAMQAVLAALRGAAFRRQAAAVPGYDAEAAGEIVSLRRTLPWYK
ncbi:substrate-binding domain-containing protein [Aromatoleum diolicum]|uniref:LysR family transcriptional regulator n=1 Tax=Aromatoleum diolicum TaxID=75796 RepID=A0ABX1QD15_9RHOO|nr:substrate-binding domain-containing protein [Aromatoleum diolicum]NMG75387.1 LysR family transcriptional regulator [Aromatoleum diolicum]